MKIASVTLLVFFCCFFSSSQAHFREKRSSGVPESEITVTLKIDWNVSSVNKEVPASYVTNVQNGTVLVDILNKAAGDNTQGPFNKYDSTYSGGSGYSITAMNGTQQNSTTGNYWFLFDEQSEGTPPCDVSSYVPVNQSTTIFRYTTRSSHNQTVTGYCEDFPPPEQVPPSAITVTLEMDWNVNSVGKPIPAAYTTQVANGTVLVDIMNKAANEDRNGPYNKWTSTYFGGLGHAITSMNGTEQDPGTKTYWVIYDKATGEPTPLGVDSYKPQDNSTTIFRLGNGTSHDEKTTTASTSPTEQGPSSSPGKLVGVGLVTMCLLAGIETLWFL